MKFKEYIKEMAFPNDNIKTKIYYHGVYNYEIAGFVLENGITPPKKSRQKKGLEAIKGGIYFAQKIKDSLIYARGLNNKQRQYRYGFIFEISGEDLMDVFPDEDDVLILLGKCMKIFDTDFKIYSDIHSDPPEEILEIVKKYYDKLSYDDRKKIDIGYSISIKEGIPVAKKVIKMFSNEDVLKIIENGYKFFNIGSIYPKNVLIIDKWLISAGDIKKYSKEISIKQLKEYFSKNWFKDSKDYFDKI